MNILIVEDDPNITDLLTLYLQKEGYSVTSAPDGRTALAAVAANMPQLILLDWMLPGKDGLTVCREIRQSSKVPIIMITAKGETDDRVLGLEAGADDYIIKPFEMKEVIARIRAVTRRVAPERERDVHLNRLEFDRLVIDKDSYQLLVNGREVDTPPKELELIYFLATTPNRVFTRNQLLDEVWGFEYFGDSRTVDVHVKRLREKLEGVSPKWTLKTVWGVGYKFELSDGA